MKQIIIGKEGNQPFVINDPNVSRRHAYLNIDEATGQMQLVDNKSTNGTFVYNGSGFVRLFANQSYNVSLDTMLQLGPNTRFHIRRLFQKPIPPKKPEKPEKPKVKRVDIRPLRIAHDFYNKEKVEIETKSGMVNGLRSCTILVSLTAAGGGKLIASGLGIEDEVTGWVLGILLGGVLMAILLTLINRFNKKIIHRRNKNEHDYAIRYCCPECHTSFKGKIYENILAEGRCPKCKAEYYEASTKK